jgi:hypothetical protein
MCVRAIDSSGHSDEATASPIYRSPDRPATGDYRSPDRPATGDGDRQPCGFAGRPLLPLPFLDIRPHAIRQTTILPPASGGGSLPSCSSLPAAANAAGSLMFVPDGLDPAVGTLDVRDAELFNMAVEAIRDAGRVPPDAERIRAPATMVARTAAMIPAMPWTVLIQLIMPGTRPRAARSASRRGTACGHPGRARRNRRSRPRG